jgi:hypothetical protein
MTSWSRGKENEEMGEEEMQSPNPGDKIAGAGRKVEGEAEQGINNVGDTISGKQQDLKGNEPNYDKEAQAWADNRGQDMKDEANRAGQWAESRGEDIKRNTE